jgi:hypothetical protein
MVRVASSVLPGRATHANSLDPVHGACDLARQAGQACLSGVVATGTGKSAASPA